MAFCFGPLFWGVIIILFGISILLNALFGINIPIGHIIFGCLLMYAGFKLLTNGTCSTHRTYTHTRSHKNRSCSGPCCGTVFSKTRTTASNDSCQTYNIAFGHNTIDLTKIDTDQAIIKVNVIFGSGILIIDSNSAFTVTVNTTFGSSSFPDGTTTAFGTHIYTANQGTTDKQIFIDVKVIFGSLAVTTTK